MARIRGIYSTGSTSLWRSLIAFLVAPLLSSLLVVSGVTLVMMLSVPASEEAPDILQLITGFLFAVLFGTLIVGGPLVYIGMIIIGLPTWLVLRFTHNESAWVYTAAGALGGWWLAPFLGGHKWEDYPLNWAGATAGALALLLFWCMGRRR